jgi:hypothetical protein
MAEGGSNININRAQTFRNYVETMTRTYTLVFSSRKLPLSNERELYIYVPSSPRHFWWEEVETAQSV